jgi:cellulose biosynthesis protein BcsQ
MKILFIPLDERPCNFNFPQDIIKTHKEIELVIPQKKLLGDKKNAADVKKLWEFVFENVADCDYAVISIDMLIYGGLIPSRIHKLSVEETQKYIANIKNIKKLNSNIKIYGFNCIMRSPQYNSGEEEPEYYEIYGYNLFRRAYLMNKRESEGISKEQESELQNIKIPKEIFEDYESRREFNLNVNMEVTELVKEGVIDFLTIPQDDSSEYGYTAIAQRKVVRIVKENKLEFKVSIYPGADEVGCSLLARVLNDHLNRTVKIYPFYASTLGESIIPLYEDRPMNESLKYHIRVCGAEIVEDYNNADIILAINCPGKKMQESFEQLTNLDLTYTSHRNLQDFVYKIKKYVQKDKKVIICDSAFSNGADLQLIDFMDRIGILDKIIAYAGWNTNCNTLGTALASGIYAFEQNENAEIVRNVIYRIIEDALYQAKVRQTIANEYLPRFGLGIYDFKDKQNQVEEEIKKLLIEEYKKLNISKIYNLNLQRVFLPWKRMFEVGLELSVVKK